MWRSLLADRFRLTFHRETRELGVYALVVGKGGPKFHQDPPDASTGESPTTSISGRNGPMRVGPEEMTMQELADILARDLDRPVLDQTGLTGQYKISLTW